MATTGSLTIYSKAVLLQDTTQQLSFGQMTAEPGATLTHAANNSTRSAILNLATSGDFDLYTGANIAVSGLGYAGGTGGTSSPGYPGSGPGGGLGGTSFSAGGSGGGHGGDGGAGNSGIAGGDGYDSITNPTNLGSGGGGQDAYYGPASGGAGGGAVIVSVGGTLTINGIVNADGVGGGNGGSSGGGAGGTVNITAATLSGSGVIHANGGAAGNSSGGSGGGGTIALNIANADNSSLVLDAAPGQNSVTGTAQLGGAGVIAIKDPGQTSYKLILGTPGIAAQAQTPITDANFVNITTIDVVGIVAVAADNFAFPLSNGGIDVKPGGNLILTANAVVGAPLLIESNGTFTQANIAGLGFSSVLVQSGGQLTHTPNGATKQSILNLDVSGNFDLQAGASIAANGMGYTGGAGGTCSSDGSAGNGPGGGFGGTGSNSGSGGAHGGGGGADSGGLPGGTSYDSITNPIDLGSGGGGGAALCGYYNGSQGSPGGGAVILSIAGTLTVDGVISADGGVSSGSNGEGGGGGGTINITAATLAGSGTIHANGTSPSVENTGGGGGGIIAIDVTGVDNSALTLDASAGQGGGTAGHAGGAGTVAIKDPGQTEYNLRIGDPGVTVQSSTTLSGLSLSFSTISLFGSIVNFQPGSLVTADELIVSSTANVTAASLSFSPIGTNIEAGGLLILNTQSISGPLTVESGGVFSQNNLIPLGFNSVVIQPGGTLTHTPNGSVRQSWLNLDVPGDFDIMAGASMGVNGMGYPGGAGGSCSVGPGNGAGAGGGLGGSPASGGGHGGNGAGTSSLAGGANYGAITSPVDFGSGGGGQSGLCGYYNGSAGGAGGGTVILAVDGTLTVNGAINADGGNGNGSSGGGGGGSINITASALAGTGSIHANGGPASSSAGGGGGGIVTIYHTPGQFAGVIQAAAGSGGHQPALNGFAINDGVLLQSPNLSFTSSYSLSLSTEQLSPPITTVPAALLEQDGMMISAVSTGTITGSFSFSSFTLTTVSGNPFPNDGFVTGLWSMTSGTMTYQGTFKGIVFSSSTSTPLSIKGATFGDINGIFDGTLTQSSQGSGIFNLFSALWQFNQVQETLTQGSDYINGTIGYSRSQQFNTSLSVLQTSVSGALNGAYSGSLNSTLTDVRVADGSNPHNGEGFSWLSFESPFSNSSSGWAYTKTLFNAITQTIGLSDDPLRGQLAGILNESVSPRTYILSTRLLSPAAALVLKTTGPTGASPGETITETIEIDNNGVTANNVSVIARFPDNCNFVSATPGYTRYTLGHFISGSYQPVPYLRWDFPQILGHSKIPINYQAMLNDNITYHEGLGGAVYVLSTSNANSVMGKYLVP
ncbi:MAG: beta strand repeat-containing protein [Elusimicrobiota bacterium]